MNIKQLAFGLLTIGLISCNSTPKEKNTEETATYSDIKIVGAMKNVMWKGELAGLIQMDSLSKKGFYGMGPLEYLKGELIILDGVVYQSSVVNSDVMIVKKSSTARAPFFAFESINEWEEIDLPAGIKNLKEFELFLDKKFTRYSIPFFFKIEYGKIWSDSSSYFFPIFLRILIPVLKHTAPLLLK